MSVGAAAFSVFILSEDGSEYAPDTLKALLKHIFRFIDERCRTHRIDFQPPDDPEVRRVLVANQWTGRKRSERVSLYKYLAERLRDDAAIIVHHIDADVRWSDRSRTPPLNASLVPDAIRKHVRALLARFYSDAELDRRLARYLLLVPYLELEAWLYQHTELALDLCRQHPTCRGRHAERLASWRADRSLLDDESDPEQSLPCIGKKHNKDLAGPGYPIKEVVAAERSLAAAVAEFFECEPLLDALARTYESSP